MHINLLGGGREKLHLCHILHVIHQLVSECVSLAFSAEQPVYSGFLELLADNSCLWPKTTL